MKQTETAIAVIPDFPTFTVRKKTNEKMTTEVTSKNGVPIRLTEERWNHIVEEHGELAGRRLEVLATVSQPLRILAGGMGEMLAVQEQESGKFLVVVYRRVDFRWLHHYGFFNS